MNTARDTYNQIDFALKKWRQEGLEKGREEGREERREEGREERNYEIAKKMIAKGLNVDTIAEFTGLNKETIAKLVQL